MAIPLILPYTTEPYEPSPAFPEQTFITRPLVLTALEYKGKGTEFAFHSVIDSGADTCMFPAQFGEAVGIPVRDGKQQATSGIGSDVAFYHSVKVYVEIQGQIWNFDCWAGFMYSLDRLGKGLLGRHGFFQLFESVDFKSDQLVLLPRVKADQKVESKSEKQAP